MVRHQTDAKQVDPVFDGCHVQQREKHETVGRGIKQQITVNGILVEVQDRLAPEGFTSGFS